MKNILFVIIFLNISCISLKIKNADDISIAKLIIHQIKADCIYNSTNISKSPSYYLNFYLVLYENKINKESVRFNLFYKDLNNIISQQELIEMQKRYNYFNKEDWKGALKNENIKIINDNNSLDCDKVTKISRPLYSKDNNKAIVVISTETDISGGSVFLKILKKENKIWKIKGGIPVGINH